MRNGLVILLVVSANVVTAYAEGSRPKAVMARVVDFEAPSACINGNGYWSMILHTQRHGGGKTAFARINFSLPCGKTPVWVGTSPNVEKYRLIRQNPCDGTLDEFVLLQDVESQRATEVPRWKHPPGTENERLPFGQVLPCYRSVTLSLTPAV